MPRRSRAIEFGVNSQMLILSYAIVALLLHSCSESKVSQCQKLLKVTSRIEVLNREFQTEIKRLPQNTKPQDADIKSLLNRTSEIWKNTGNEFIKISQDIRALNLSDDRIKIWQSKYINLLVKYQQNLNRLSTLLMETALVNKAGELPVKFEKLERDGSSLFQELPKLDAEHKQLEKEIKLYCQSN